MLSNSTDNAYTDKRFGCPLLSEKNYPTWESSIKMRLITENCWEIVVGEEDAPSAPELAEGASRAVESAHTVALKEHKAEAIDFAKQAGKAALIINSTLSSGGEFYVKDTIDPREMWEILRNKLTLVDNWGLQRTLKRDFYKTYYDGKEPITAYINRLRVFQQQLQGTNNEVSNDELVNRIMTSLPTTCEQRLITLDDRRDLTLDDLERALRNHEAKISDIPTQATKALATARYSKRGRGRGRSGRNRGGRHSDRRSFDLSTRSCWYCLKAGHSQNDCFVKKKADEGRRERMKRQAAKGSESQGPSSSVSLADAHALMTKRESVTYALGDWFIDSGATDHMCNEQGDFFSLKRLYPPVRVVLGDNTAVHADRIGSIYLNPKVLLTRVLFVPDLGTWLLSVSAVTQLGCQMVFDRSGCKIWKDNIDILSASSQGNLFKVDLHHTNISKAIPNNSGSADGHANSEMGDRSNIDNVIATNSFLKQRGHNLQLWHQRLGYLNLLHVRQLAELGTGVTINQSQSALPPCPACLQGKQQRSFNRQNIASHTVDKLP